IDKVYERAECSALELRAHGAGPTAAALLDRIATVLGPNHVTDSGEAGPCLWNLFSAHYYAGRWEEVTTGYMRRGSACSTNVEAHAALAALAVRRGDSLDIRRQKAWLSHEGDAAATLGLARVAALEGNRDEAVALLRKALDQAVERHFLHIDPDFDSLR